MSGPRPKIFIGSSREAVRYAKAIQYDLRDVADAEVWSQGWFRVGSVTLDDLVRAVNGFDFGVFIFAPDDIVKMRDKSYLTVRDNVLFELGMFIGKLTPQRSFFVMPEGEDQFHLPSDLHGIKPARYDPKNASVQSAVVTAVFEISQAIERLGALHGSQIVLYKSEHKNLSRDFRGVEAFVFKNGEQFGDKAKAQLIAGPEGLVTVERKNKDGKFAIELRPEGPDKPSFAKSVILPRRVICVSCELKSENASRVVRFVVKDEQAPAKWLADRTVNLEPGDWAKVSIHLWIDATKDFLFRIDDESVSAASSILHIRNLIITEERI